MEEVGEVPPVMRAILLSRVKRDAMGGRSDMIWRNQDGRCYCW